MKIIVLHGDDEKKVYARLSKFIETARKRSWEVTFLDDSNLSIQESLSGTSLFEAERFFILRDIKKLGKKEIEWLNKKVNDLSGNLIIYHEGTIGALILKSLPKETTVEEFKLPKLIWGFLDLIKPGNSIQIVKTFHKIIETEAPEFIFAMIVWKLKKNYLTKPSPEIAKMINDMAIIDFEVKTGKANLVSSLDLMFIKSLE